MGLQFAYTILLETLMFKILGHFTIYIRDVRNELLISIWKLQISS